MSGSIGSSGHEFLTGPHYLGTNEVHYQNGQDIRPAVLKPRKRKACGTNEMERDLPMAKKLSLLIAAVAVLAFAVPAAASAAAPLMMGGTAVPVGTGITGTSTNAKTKTSLGTLTCKSVVLKGKVTANEEKEGKTKAEGGSSEEFTGSECEVEGVKVPVEKITLTNLKTGTALGFTTGNGTATFSFTTLLAGQDCVFTGTNAPFTYSTTTMTNQITFTNVSVTGNPTACGNGTFSGTFALTTTSGGGAIEIT